MLIRDRFDPSALRHLLSTDASDLGVILTTCLLFSCIETLLGNINGASYHIIGGFKLLVEAGQEQDVRCTDSHSARVLPSVSHELTRMFADLEVHCNLPHFFSEAPIQYPSSLDFIVPSSFSISTHTGIISNSALCEDKPRFNPPTHFTLPLPIKSIP